MSKLRRKVLLFLTIASFIGLLTLILVVYKKPDAGVTLSDLSLTVVQHSAGLVGAGLLFTAIIGVVFIGAWITSGSGRSAVDLLEVWSLFLPMRIQREELGDAIEDVNRRILEGQPNWRIKVRALMAIFWTAISTIHYLKTQVNVRFLKRVFTALCLLVAARWVGSSDILHRFYSLTTDVAPITAPTQPAPAPSVDPTAVNRQQAIDEDSLTKESLPKITPAKRVLPLVEDHSSIDVRPTDDVIAQPEVAFTDKVPSPPTVSIATTDTSPSPAAALTGDGANGDSGAVIAAPIPTPSRPSGSSLGLMGVGR
jgi:hypothetical protein